MAERTKFVVDEVFNSEDLQKRRNNFEEIVIRIIRKSEINKTA